MGDAWHDNDPFLRLILTRENLLPIMVQTHLDFGALNVLPFPFEVHSTELLLCLYLQIKHILNHLVSLQLLLPIFLNHFDRKTYLLKIYNFRLHCILHRPYPMPQPEDDVPNLLIYQFPFWYKKPLLEWQFLQLIRLY